MRNTPGLLIYRRWRRALVHLILYLPQVRLAKAAYVQETRTNLWRGSVKASQRVYRRGDRQRSSHGNIAMRPRCAALCGLARTRSPFSTQMHEQLLLSAFHVYVCIFQGVAPYLRRAGGNKSLPFPPPRVITRAPRDKIKGNPAMLLAADARQAIMHFYVSARSAGIVIGRVCFVRARGQHSLILCTAILKPECRAGT